MNPRRAAILGTGHYLPARRVSAEDLDRRFGLGPGTVARTYGVVERHYVAGETASQMGAAAARQALAAAGLAISEIDAIISAQACPDQLIPCNAALVQKELGPGAAGIP